MPKSNASSNVYLSVPVASVAMRAVTASSRPAAPKPAAKWGPRAPLPRRPTQLVASVHTGVSDVQRYGSFLVSNDRLQPIKNGEGEVTAWAFDDYVQDNKGQWQGVDKDRSWVWINAMPLKFSDQPLQSVVYACSCSRFKDSGKTLWSCPPDKYSSQGTLQ